MTDVQVDTRDRMYRFTSSLLTLAEPLAAECGFASDDIRLLINFQLPPNHEGIHFTIRSADLHD